MIVPNHSVLRTAWQQAGSAGLPSTVKSPSGAYPRPEISTRIPSAHNWVTVISFCVSVPVLSEQITVAEPRVSTEASRRISAWRLIISRMPSARLMVTTAGSPSGTAAIARLTATMKYLTIVLPESCQ